MAGWTDDEDKRLIELCALGLVHREIGERIGRPRNSCISRARRLGVSNGRQTGSQQKRKPKAKTAPKSASKKPKGNGTYFGVAGGLTKAELAARKVADKALPDVEASEEAKEVESPEPVTLLEREDHQCCWPIGDPRFDDFRYCGNETKDGHADYCEGHAGVSRQGVPRRKKIVPDQRDQRAGQSSALQGWF